MNKKLYSQGLVQIYTGNGKGKTSAALGLVVRAIGHGAKIHIIFFMKGDFPYGELDSLLKLPGVTYQTFGHEHFVDPHNVKAEEKEQAQQALKAASEALVSNKLDLLVLDEINVASAWKLIELDDVLALIASKPQYMELVLTGRYADRRLIEKADLVTNMEEVKHPYNNGIEARKGIEY
jgi:cob(I)alamin adenosyltransferase